jgi:hypothetical protein
VWEHGQRRNAYKILFGNLEVKSLLERARTLWEDNIKMGL